MFLIQYDNTALVYFLLRTSEYVIETLAEKWLESSKKKKKKKKNLCVFVIHFNTNRQF